jgi:cellulose synthase (UDP-forming)
MNLIWTVFNLIVLGVATAVAWESQQRRQTVRVQMNVPADVVLADGTVVQGATADLSTGGARINIDRGFTALPGEAIRLVFPVLDGDATLPATVISADGRSLRAQFDPLSLQEEEALTMVLYSRADTWLGWGESRETDHPLQSLGRIFKISMQGLGLTARGLMKPKKKTPKGRLAASAAPLVLFALLAASFGRSAQAAQVQAHPAPPVTAPHAPSTPLSGAIPNPAALTGNEVDGGIRAHPVAPGNFDNIFTLADIGVPDTIVLRGVDAYHSVFFSVPQTQIVKSATMHIRYHFSPGLLPDISHLKVSLNGTLFATLPVIQRPIYSNGGADLTPDQKVAEQQVLNVTRNENNALLEATLTMPAEMLVHQNELTFEFIGHYTYQCEDPSHSTLWSHVDANTTIELAGSTFTLPNDLSLLPLPFYDAAVNLHPSISIVFLTQTPSAKALRAAGIVASFFGILTDYRPVHFKVSFGAIPEGNAIVIGESVADLPASLNVTSNSGPTLAMRTNPVDPYSKLLVLSGDTPDELIIAAEALALTKAGVFQGDQQRATIDQTNIKVREPDDAPRWMSTDPDKITHIGDIAQTGDLQGDGSVPVAVYLRVPPDLYYPPLQNLSYHMSYRYNGIPLANESSLQVYMNGSYVSSTPMPHTENASAQLDTVVPIPVDGDMRPFSNSLMMKFVFQIAKKGKCQDTAPTNLQGAVLKSSWLDIRNIPHWHQMPDLQVFANAGYPFTRKADLADTAVVLPDVPTVDEIEMFLTLMGHFGAQTGYPVINVQVTNAAGMKTDRVKDYLVMGTVDDQPAINSLNPSLPVRVEGSGLRIQDTQGFFTPLQHAWWKVRSSDHVNSGTLATTNGLPDVLIEGMEWPSGSSKSVVLIALRDHSVVPNFINVFLKNSQNSDIDQSVSVLHGSRFVSYRIGNDVYHVGSLSPLVRLKMLFSEFSWLTVIVVVLICFLIAAIMRALLRRHARTRLQGNE